MSQFASILCLFLATACSDAKDDTKSQGTPPAAKPAAPPAAQSDKQPAGASSALTFECESPAKVAVGDMIQFKCTLKNSGGDTVVKEAMLDAKSFDFGVKFGSKSSTYTAYHPVSYQPSTLKGVDLKAGATLEFQCSVPAVKVGEWTFTPRYHGAEGGAIEAPARTITVEAKDGATEVLAHFVTDAGEMKAAFWPEVAPATSLHMAGLVKKGYFDGLKFHRTIQGFMIQGGDPQGNGSGGPGYSIEAEFNSKPHEPGVFSMARVGDPMEQTGAAPRPQFANSAGSQFFLVDQTSSFLDNKYTVFGKLVEGVDVVHAIAGKPVSDGPIGRGQTPVKPVVMSKVELVLKK